MGAQYGDTQNGGTERIFNGACAKWGHKMGAHGH